MSSVSSIGRNENKRKAYSLNGEAVENVERSAKKIKTLSEQRLERLDRIRASLDFVSLAERGVSPLTVPSPTVTVHHEDVTTSPDMPKIEPLPPSPEPLPLPEQEPENLPALSPLLTLPPSPVVNIPIPSASVLALPPEIETDNLPPLLPSETLGGLPSIPTPPTPPALEAREIETEKLAELPPRPLLSAGSYAPAGHIPTPPTPNYLPL